LAAPCPNIGVVLNTADKKQLFLDDTFLVETMVRVRPVMHQPLKQGPVLFPDKPWEKGGFHRGSVIFEDGLFKMWYGALDEAGKTQCVCYATSRDGRAWEKPSLGIFEWEGSGDNNILMMREEEDNLGPVCVFKDPADRDPERRYKLVYGHFSEDEAGRRIFGLSAATSPDGLHWTRIPKPLFTDDRPFDTFNIVFWDDYLGKYVAYVRRRVKQKAPREDRFPAEPTARRFVGRAESTDFVNWTSPNCIVLGPDDRDPLESDYYGPGVFKYCDHAYFMMTPFFDHTTDQVLIRLASSRENLVWRFVGERLPFINHGDPGQWDSMQIYPLVPAVPHGDRLYIYYLGSDIGHYAGRPRSKQKRNVAIGLATLPLDGFVSLQAGYMPGVVTTWPLRFKGNCLFLNVETHKVDEETWPESGLAVEILDEEGYVIPGHERKSCDRITESDSRQRVSWKGRWDIGSLEGTPVKLRFHLRFAKIRSFQFAHQSD